MLRCAALAQQRGYTALPRAPQVLRALNPKLHHAPLTHPGVRAPNCDSDPVGCSIPHSPLPPLLHNSMLRLLRGLFALLAVAGGAGE